MVLFFILELGIVLSIYVVDNRVHFRNVKLRGIKIFEVQIFSLF